MGRKQRYDKDIVSLKSKQQESENYLKSQKTLAKNTTMKLKKLKQESENVQKEFIDVNEKYNKAKSGLNNLINDHTITRSKYLDLKVTYQKLQSTYNQLHKNCQISKSLDNSYQAKIQSLESNLNLKNQKISKQNLKISSLENKIQQMSKLLDFYANKKFDGDKYFTSSPVLEKMKSDFLVNKTSATNEILPNSINELNDRIDFLERSISSSIRGSPVLS